MKTLLKALVLSLSFTSIVAGASTREDAKSSVEQTGDDAKKHANSLGDEAGETAHQFGKFGKTAAKDMGDSVKRVFGDSNSKLRASPTPTR